MNFKAKFKGGGPVTSLGSSLMKGGRPIISLGSSLMKGERPVISLGSSLIKTKKGKPKVALERKAGDDSDEFFRRESIRQSATRFSLQRTWSMNAVQIFDPDDSNSEKGSESDSDDESDELYLSDDEEEDNTTAKKTNRKQAFKTGRSFSFARKSTTKKIKKKSRPLNNAPGVIPEGNEDDEMDDICESDDNSSSCYQTPFSSTSERLFSNDTNGEDFDTGYSSDSALVRKRMATIQQQQADGGKKRMSAIPQQQAPSNHEKKKKIGKKKPSAKKKEKKNGEKNRNNLEREHSTRSASGRMQRKSVRGRLDEDSTVTTNSVESEEEARQSDETKGEKNGKKKKKKKKKNSKDGNHKKGKRKKKQKVISFVVDGDDEECANFDKYLEEIELFEAALVEERKSILKERETMAFKVESMEIQLDEETQHCDELDQRIKELEHLVQSQQMSNAGNVVGSADEKQQLKTEFAREKRQLHLELVDKEREIADLKLVVQDQKAFQGATQNGEDNIADGKSRERLQGELLQTVAKLTHKDVELKSQAEELDLAREEIASLKANSELLELKKCLTASQEDTNKVKQELDDERKENIAKLKDKDETVTYFMNELARLKQSKGL